MTYKADLAIMGPSKHRIMSSNKVENKSPEAHPIRRSEPTTRLRSAILNPEEVPFHLTASLYKQQELCISTITGPTGMPDAMLMGTEADPRHTNIRFSHSHWDSGTTIGARLCHARDQALLTWTEACKT